MKKKVKIHYSSIFAIIFIIASIYLIHGISLFDKIEHLLRYTIMTIIVIIDLFVIWRLLFAKRKKKKKRYIFSIFLIIFSILYIFVGFNLNRVYSYLHSFFTDINKSVVYSTSLVALKENGEVNLNDLKGKKIGLSTEGDTQNLSKEIIDKYSLSKNNTIVDYESDSKMILDLYDKKIDFAFLPTNFTDVYGNREEFEDIGEKLVAVDTAKKEVTKEEVKLSGSSKDLTEPFTILLIGIDSTVNGLQNADSFNGDSLILVTFNPSTMNATMLSIPRDSYVPITCMNNIENKITHSAAQGTNCVINTIQNFLDVKIDYYMKINFTGVVDLVNALGKVEVDVEYDICEQDSKRRFGDHTVYVRKGLRKLNGEQALAYARNRKNYTQYCTKKWTQGERSDFKRSEHQQQVIQAILNKMKDFKSLDDLQKLLKVISKNLDTNMSESTMFSFYNIAKDVLISSASDEVISIQKLFLDGTGQMIYDERSNLVLWDYVLNQDSLNAVKKAMKDNLNGAKQELITEFSYSYGEEYKTKVIGEGYGGTTTYPLLKSLVGMKLSEAQSWARSKGITLNVKYVKSSGRANDTIISQDYPENKRIDLIKNGVVTVKVVQNNDGGSNNNTEKDNTDNNTQNDNNQNDNTGDNNNNNNNNNNDNNQNNDNNNNNNNDNNGGGNEPSGGNDNGNDPPDNNNENNEG
jgi:LCP family protein required for cell wall assembly